MTTPTNQQGSIRSGLSLAARIILGGLFILAAYNKLGDPQSFAFAIKGFKVIPETNADPLIIAMAFVVPWTELIAGVLVVLGLWTRPAALVLAGMLVMFEIALISVLMRPEISVDCSCFGDLSLVCPPQVGLCQVLRNVVLLAFAALPLTIGGGRLSLDHFISPTKPA